MAATIPPLTVQDIMDSIHVAYESATDTPAITDDDGEVRLDLINKGIRRWQFDNGIRWRELYVYNAVGPTLTSGVLTYPLSQTDFRELASGKLRIIRTDGAITFLDVVTGDYYASTNQISQTTAFISGNPSSGYVLNLGFLPNTTNGTIGGVVRFDYYKYAKKMALTTDIPEMSNPGFLVDYAVGELFVNDDINLYSKFNGDALNSLANMRDENEAMPAYASNGIQDQGSWTGGLGFGA